MPHDKNVTYMRTCGQSCIAILDRLQPRDAIETITFEAISSFQDATHASVSSGEKLPEYIPHAMRHPKRQPHATTAARVVVIIVFFRLVAQMEGLALVVVFNPMFGVFRSLKDSHLHISDGVCKHHTLVMNVQHATLSRAVVAQDVLSVVT